MIVKTLPWAVMVAALQICPEEQIVTEAQKEAG